MATATKPTLWHLGISHYSEKVRWALEYKGVSHERKAPQPPAHMLVALALTRGRQYTFPVLQLDGDRIGDSSAIIAALEERHPDPPLYPADPADRARALALEEYFDEELGPPMRLLAWHELTHQADSLEQITQQVSKPALAKLPGATVAVRTFVNARYRVQGRDRAAEARESIVAAFDRLEAELGGGEYLVGDTFGVADLTAAALFYPLVRPPEGPELPPLPDALDRFRAPLKDRPGYRWVEEMFRRHRRRLP